MISMIFTKRLAISVIILSFISILFPWQIAEAVCLKRNSRRYSAAIDKGIKGTKIIPGGVAELTRVSVGAGTGIGQLINLGLARWWDPILEVIPNDPNNIVTPLSNIELFALSDTLLQDFGNAVDPGSDVTLGELQTTLNIFSPGMGDAAVNFFTSGVSSYFYVVQGAAAASQKPFGDPTIIQAANLVNQSLSTYQQATLNFATFLDDFEFSTPYVVDDYLSFLDNIKDNGSLGLPLSEVELGEEILSAANVFIQDKTLSNVLVEQLSEGDVDNEASLFPVGGFSPRQLLESGAEDFNLDVLECDISKATVPEPTSTLSLLSLGILGAGATLKRKVKRTHSTEKEPANVG